MTQSAIDNMHDRMQWYVDEDILSCCETLVLQRDRVIDHYRCGFMDKDDRRPLARDAIWRMYSNTKIVTSVALLILVEEGRAALDDRVADHLPVFGDLTVLRADATSLDDTEPLDRPILIRHLLSHSAGLSYGFIEPESLIDRAYAECELDPINNQRLTLEALCERLGKLPLAYQPGTSWRYSYATDVCAHLVERLSGMAFDKFLERRVFQPLGMSDTGFHVPEEKRDRLITMYAAKDPLQPMQGGLFEADSPRASRYLEKPPFLSGGAGLVSTVKDYLAFMQMLRNGGVHPGGRLLQARTVAAMRENQLSPGVEVTFPDVAYAGHRVRVGTSAP